MSEPTRMHKVDALLLNESKDKVISALHKAGVTEIDFLEDEFLAKNKVTRDVPLEKVGAVAKNIIGINRVLGSLKQFDTAKGSFLEEMLCVDMVDKTDVSSKDYNEILKDSNSILSEIASDVAEIDANIEKLNSEESEIIKNIEECKTCPKDLKIEDLGCGEFLYSITGVVQSGAVSQIENELNKNFKPCFFKSADIAGETKKPDEMISNVVIAVAIEQKTALDDLLNKTGVKTLSIKGSGTINDALKKLTGRLNELKAEKVSLNERLHKIYKKYYKRILISKELLEIEKERCEAFVSGAATKKTGMIRFWVPENESKKIQDIIQKESENFCEISVKTDVKTDAPVILNNSKFVKPFEFLTRMYGLPKYGNIDPTIFVIPFIVLFIGMMVADAVTGLILVILGVYLTKKYGKYSVGVKNLMTLIILCGFMAIIVGVTTGEYFGNLLHDYLHITMPFQMFHPQTTDLYLFLQFSILLGLFHLILGTLLGFYNDLRHGKVMDGITEYFGWSLFGFGLGVIFLSTKIFSIENPLSAAFKFGNLAVVEAGGRVIPAVFGELGGLGVILIIIGLILAFIKHKFMILIEFIDFFAFTLSYARITALLIAAGAVASAFNQLASLAGGAPVIGSILAVVVFVIAHLIAMFLAILDGFVQSLRLVYVEHFSRYYKGGGREFKAFKAKRRYTLG